MNELAKTFIIVGFVIVAIGFGMLFWGRIPWLGKLPGDIFIKRENFSFYFPLTTSIILSVILSLILYIWKQR